MRPVFLTGDRTPDPALSLVRRDRWCIGIRSGVKQPTPDFSAALQSPFCFCCVISSTASRCLHPVCWGRCWSSAASTPDTANIDFAAVVLYTAVHFLAFLAFGFLVTMLVRIAAREPACLIALVILFACFEVAFYVVLQTVADEVSRMLPLLWVLGANLLATAVMGVYLWKRYPELGRALKREPLGA